MKKLLLISFCTLAVNFTFSQVKGPWKSVSDRNVTKNKTVERESFPEVFELVLLDLNAFKQTLQNVPDRLSRSAQGVIISLPNAEGKLERFEIFEASNFEPSLQAQFPEIRSYAGQGIEDKTAVLRLSLDARGIQTMVFRADKSAEFMEPYSEDGKVYAVYNSARKKGKLPFTCSTPEQIMTDKLSSNDVISRSSTGTLLNFRLALSCNGEYANYFGATSAAQVANVLAAFNATMTRVNGVFEKDFAIHMNIVASTTNVIYYNPATDPYTTLASWNTQLQQALNTTLTGPSTSLAANNAAYDVGHMFGATGGGGSAGCIGCVCVNGTASGTGATKGRGITSPADGVPMGDTFDIDYVAHELGHQFGANHTFSHSNEGYGVNKEVGGGVTVMGYAGITNYNTHMNSIDVFHSASIAQVQANMVGKTCPTSTPITHSAPVVNAGADYTIPLSTPFILTGSATDAGGASGLTYTWEQNDDGGANINAASVASPTKTEGPNFVCYPASVNPYRYFPTYSSILNGSTTTAGVGVTMEALSSVARTLNFRLTARDNVAGQGQTNFDDVIVTVANKTALNVTMAAGTSYPVGSSQTVVWTGATGANGHSTIAGGNNVDILFSSDNGVTWSTLLTATNNDGSEVVTLPAGVAAPYCRFMVKASGNVFFNISQPFAVGYTLSTVCQTYSNNTALPIPDGLGANVSGGNVSKSIVTTGIQGIISDVNVHVTSGHSYFWDLNVFLTHQGEGAVSNLLARNCNNSTPSGFNITFDDSGATLVCTNPVSGTYVPASVLSVFNGKDPNTTWTITANDNYNGDTGNIDTFEIEICTIIPTLSVNSFSSLEDLVLYPNPNNGTFNIQMNLLEENTSIKVFDIRGRLMADRKVNATGLVNEVVNLQSAQSGIYLVTIENGSKKVTKKIVVE
ncbi:zinc-dependent metalloprotease [Flavobacterium haoranii]|uniref:Por secretion system C-terminal sorting domain-containing protein n=1 Tax=Flavobacterium haoranii TaxID=683124 RepID=A0A1M6DKH3_9FLAO|nr:zinc-dependent metalloprotease family protein [Flavobacterium haoranii]SHI73641.1 Por secretion system C-terminal sorting domain-containing protein [Flavobacterium haoranii]